MVSLVEGAWPVTDADTAPCRLPRPRDDVYAQAQVDEAEYNNPANWKCFFYHSRRDSRVWVPKKFGYGWTVNFATTGGQVFMGAIATLAVGSIAYALWRA